MVSHQAGAGRPKGHSAVTGQTAARPEDPWTRPEVPWTEAKNLGVTRGAPPPRRRWPLPPLRTAVLAVVLGAQVGCAVVPAHPTPSEIPAECRVPTAEPSAECGAALELERRQATKDSEGGGRRATPLDLVIAPFYILYAVGTMILDRGRCGC